MTLFMYSAWARIWGRFANRVLFEDFMRHMKDVVWIECSPGMRRRIFPDWQEGDTVGGLFAVRLVYTMPDNAIVFLDQAGKPLFVWIFRDDQVIEISMEHSMDLVLTPMKGSPYDVLL